MNVYVVMDCSLNMVLDMSNREGRYRKFDRGVRFLGQVVEALDKNECEITLVALRGTAQIVGEAVTSAEEVRSAFHYGVIAKGDPNFLTHRNMLFNKHQSTNYELIALIEASNFQIIPLKFSMPCALRFVAIGSGGSFSSKMLEQLESVSRKCAIEAGHLTGNAEHEAGGADNAASFRPLLLRDGNLEAEATLVKQLATPKRTENFATLDLAPAAMFIKIFLQPGLPVSPFLIRDAGDETVYKPLGEGLPTSVTLKLIGFTKSAALLNLPSADLLHAVKPQASAGDDNLRAYRNFAEALGSEEQVGIFRLGDGDSAKACVLKPVRKDAGDSWLLCLQFMPTNTFDWVMIGKEAVEKHDPTFALDQGISYRAAATRTYWNDSHGVQSDITKISRLLKRADKLEQFHAEMRRVAAYAVACGHDSFAPQMAECIERKAKAGGMASENSELLDRVVHTLKTGGFKAILKYKSSAADSKNQ